MPKRRKKKKKGLTSEAMAARSMRLAAGEGDMATLRDMLSKSRGFETDAPNAAGYTALDNACIHGHADVVDYLLKVGASAHGCNLPMKRGKTPLHLAAHQGGTHVIRRLLKAGADPLAVDWEQQTPLDLAKDTNVRTLLKEATKREDDPGSTRAQEVKMEKSVTPSHSLALSGIRWFQGRADRPVRQHKRYPPREEDKGHFELVYFSGMEGRKEAPKIEDEEEWEGDEEVAQASHIWESSGLEPLQRQCALDTLKITRRVVGGAAFVSRFFNASDTNMLQVDVSGNCEKLCKALEGGVATDAVQGRASLVDAFPFSDDAFDVVVNVESCHGVVRFGSMLEEVYRVLKPNGLFMWSDFRANDAFVLDTLKHQMVVAGLHLIRMVVLAARDVEQVFREGDEEIGEDIQDEGLLVSPGGGGTLSRSSLSGGRLRALCARFGKISVSALEQLLKSVGTQHWEQFSDGDRIFVYCLAIK